MLRVFHWNQINAVMIRPIKATHNILRTFRMIHLMRLTLRQCWVQTVTIARNEKNFIEWNRRQLGN